MAQIILYSLGVYGQVDNLFTMDPLDQHVGDSIQSLLHVAQFLFLEERKQRVFTSENLGLPAHICVCVPG